MNRAERRRLNRIVEKNKVSYKVSNEQLDIMKRNIARDIGDKMEDRFIKVFFSMPMHILHERLNWTPEECRWFAEAMCDEYTKTLYGNCTDKEVEKYCKLTEELTGIGFRR